MVTNINLQLGFDNVISKRLFLPDVLVMAFRNQSRWDIWLFVALAMQTEGSQFWCWFAKQQLKSFFGWELNSDCLSMHPWLAVAVTDVNWLKEAVCEIPDLTLLVAFLIPAQIVTPSNNNTSRYQESFMDGSFLQSAAPWYLSGQSDLWCVLHGHSSSLALAHRKHSNRFTHCRKFPSGSNGDVSWCRQPQSRQTHPSTRPKLALLWSPHSSYFLSSSLPPAPPLHLLILFRRTTKQHNTAKPVFLFFFQVPHGSLL